MRLLGVEDQHVLVVNLNWAKWALQLEASRFVELLKLGTFRRLLSWWTSFLLLGLVFIFISLVLFRICATTDEEAQDLVAKRKFLLITRRFLYSSRFAPLKHGIWFLNFFIEVRFNYGFTSVSIFKSMSHTEMHLAVGALKVVDVCDFGLATLCLTVAAPSILRCL